MFDIGEWWLMLQKNTQIILPLPLQHDVISMKNVPSKIKFKTKVIN